MRAFIAVFPPPAPLAHLASSLAASRDAFPELRWQPPDRWHATLAFLGRTDPAKIDALVAGLHEAARGAQPLADTRIAGAGTFGAVLWMGLACAEDRRLHQLARACRRSARAAGAQVDRTKFAPHVTVARSRDGAGQVRAAMASLREYSGPVWTIDGIRLVESITGPAPRYATLAEFELGSGRLDG